VSRGLGATQRAILAALADARAGWEWPPWWWTSARELAEVIYGRQERAQVQAVRRAIHGLARAGLVEMTRYSWTDGWVTTGVPQRVELRARLPLTEIERGWEEAAYAYERRRRRGGIDAFLAKQSGS
jgi:hypothetical protein